jgi:hypothetical protein
LKINASQLPIVNEFLLKPTPLLKGSPIETFFLIKCKLFVMELFGRWGTKTRYIFQKIVRLWCEREGLSVSIISHRWKTLLTSQMMLVGMREALHKKSLAVREYSGDNAGIDQGSLGGNLEE